MPRGRRKAAPDQSLLEAALIGFEQMRRNIEEKIADLRRQVGFGAGATAAETGQTRRRTLSPAARRRIAAAQRKRWALAKAKEARPKRTMSAAARKKIAAAQRKRWAAVKKAQARTTAKRQVKKRAAGKEAAQTAGAAA